MPDNVELKSTIRLPRTGFPMKANLPQREAETLDWWDRIGAYARVREARRGCPSFVLHDGPPYANGHIHLGHAFNKILKDVVVKSRSMMGHDAPYVPGWDCHGLPIEHRVEKELGDRKAGMSALEVREHCRAYAESFVVIQGGEFRRLGILWDRDLEAFETSRAAPSRKAIYRTLDRTYEAEIVRQIGGFFTRGAVYHGEKPVHWCPSCTTALAEAEVEYEERTDSSVYVALPVTGLEARVPALAGRSVALLIWTTTPWTLPANLAVALHPDLPYVAVGAPDGRTYIVAQGLLEQVADRLGWPWRVEDLPQPAMGRTVDGVVATFTGRDLVGEGDDWIGARAPIERPYPMRSGPGSGPGVLVLGGHVTLEGGTGLVHTAPGHGADDFHVGKAYGLPPFNPVDDRGRFIPERVSEPWLAGAFVLQANAAIVQDLERRGLLLAHEPYRHSYPHCWRCKSPVLFRSTPQWFIAMDAQGLRAKALEAIRGTAWIPSHGEDRIAGMVENRPDWCISRQRTWGVPIPAVVCGTCLEEHADAFVRDPAFFTHLARLFLEEGSNAWFGAPVEGALHRPYDSHDERLARLVPQGVACPRCGRRDGLRFHEHIVDVWFESGVSHRAVLGSDASLPWPADLYLEGHDQYRGWFQSSLLVSVGDSGDPPYRQVVTHGFALDAQGRKMSKSLGNVISPHDVCDRRGAEILRLWVSAVDYAEDMRLSEEVLDRGAEAYRKIRNTFRFLLGNLDGFDPRADALPYERMEEIDRWALQQLEALRSRLHAAYGAHQYHLVHHGLHHFCTVTLSSFYLDILKDRLYTYPARSPARRSAQTALHRLAEDLCRLMAPVLAFTAEEVWQELETLRARPGWAESTVHAQLFPEPLPIDAEPALQARWERLIAVREEVTRALETSRRDRVIGSSLEAKVRIEADPETEEFLRSFGEGLRFLLLTSGVEFGPVVGGVLRSERIPGLAVAVDRADGAKCERCWNWTTDVGVDAAWPGACGRCVVHVREVLLERQTA